MFCLNLRDGQNKIEKGDKMSQGIIITLIICGTILLLGLGGMIVTIYAIKKGAGWMGRMITGDWWKKEEKKNYK